MSYNFESEVRLLKKRYFRYGMTTGILKIQGEQILFTPANLSTPLFFNLSEVQSYKKYLTMLEIKANNKIYAFELQPRTTKPEALAAALTGFEDSVEKAAIKSHQDYWVYAFQQSGIPKHKASRRVWVPAIVWSVFMLYVFFMMYITRDTSIENTRR